MIDKEIHAQFDEFMNKFKADIAANSFNTVLTEEEALELIGFRVEKIRTYILKTSVEDKKDFIGNKLCDLFIIGSAFPMLEGWKLQINKDTRFIAYGFKKEMVTFKFNYVNDILELELIDNEYISRDLVYDNLVEYTEESATAMSFYRTKAVN